MSRLWNWGLNLPLGIALLCSVLLLGVAPTSVGQTLISGDITGSVLDPTSAVVPNATVVATNLGTGAVQRTTTNPEGVYRFSLLKPGRYSVSVSVPGFSKLVTTVNVELGQTTNDDLKLEVSKGVETVEVTGTSPLINTDPGNSTAFTQEEIQLLPSGGADITNIAFTAPGAVVNVTGGYGNFTINGLPATSNLFTINGENDMDPYFNINNSGATNLTLGQNEIQEATIVTNPYEGQYGQLMGSQVTYITKSGSNDFHGNAQYWWNGRYLNANNFFANASGSPRPFSNANQWAASLGGPILKNKTFFFVDTEGMRFVLPNVDTVTVPSPAFASAVLANIQANQPNEASTYKTMLGVWQNANGAANASPQAMTACNTSTLNIPGFTANASGTDSTGALIAGSNCAVTFTTTPTSFAKEWIISGRVDQKITDKDNAFFRYKVDHGLQPTYLDPFSSTFNALSNQPAWDAQANETHIFSSTMTNAFTAAVSHYVAQFAQNTALVQQTFPYALNFAGAVAQFSSFNPAYAFPQGRNITQYQFIDDYAWTHGQHNWKFGVNFRRYDVSDHNFFYNTPLVYFRNVPGLADPSNNGLQAFADGVAFQYRRADNLASDVPVALWGIGFYAQDEWHLSPKLTLTLALRVERNSNPVCQTNCFANFTGAFSTLASVQAGSNAGNVPYSSDIASNQHQAFQGVDALVYSPRVAFSWSPFGDNKTVISGGAGLFYDNPAAGLVDDLLANPPVAVALRVRPSTGTLPFDTTSNGAAASFNAATSKFDITQSYNTIKKNLAAIGVNFTAPAVTSIVGTVHAPQAQEWNLKIQHEFTKNTALTVNYVGNHVIQLPYTNPWPNAFDAPGLFTASASGSVPGVSETGPAVPNYGTVTQVQSGAVSNYNGVSVSLREQVSTWILAHFNYTYSHNLDEVSNGGIFTYGDSLLGQINPLSLKANNYGNSDYDIRHNISLDYVLSPNFHFRNGFIRQVASGWQWAGKMFWRTGLPYSIVDGNWNGSFLNGGGTILAQPLAGVAAQGSCGNADVITNGAAAFGSTACLNSAAFIDSAAATFPGYSQWSPQTRNQFRGPHYFDMDMGLFRNFRFKERMSAGIGIQAFNVFNHPNFALPDANLGDATFGQITSTVGTPTSPYGNFLGFDSSVRVVPLSAKITF
jgi:hypothetical protein